jgi:hypothetical protein
MPGSIERRFAPCPFCAGPVRAVFRACPHCGRQVSKSPPLIYEDTLDAYDFILWCRRPELAPPEFFWPPVNPRTGERSPAYQADGPLLIEPKQKERDLWLVEQERAGRDRKAVLIELKTIGPAKGWEELSESGHRNVLNAAPKKYGIAPIPPRKRGRKKSQ